MKLMNENIDNGTPFDWGEAFWFYICRGCLLKIKLREPVKNWF